MYTTTYDNLTVQYEIEGDVDGAYAVIKSISSKNCHTVHVDKETYKDIKFICECEFSDLQWQIYMKTGQPDQMIAERCVSMADELIKELSK